jgi:hypothetical protein
MVDRAPERLRFAKPWAPAPFFASGARLKEPA